MTNEEMLLSALNRSGWNPTTETDETGAIICKAGETPAEG